MARWTGYMRTAYLRTIPPTDFPTWAHARRQFAQHDHDRQIVLRVTEDIRAGRVEPLYLGVDDNTVYLTDGHHRAVALMGLRKRTFPFQWFRIGGRVRFEASPFPYDLLD